MTRSKGPFSTMRNKPSRDHLFFGTCQVIHTAFVASYSSPSNALYFSGGDRLTISGFVNRFRMSPETHSCLVPLSSAARADSQLLPFSNLPVWIFTCARVGSSSYKWTILADSFVSECVKDSNLRLHHVRARSAETSTACTFGVFWTSL